MTSQQICLALFLFAGVVAAASGFSRRVGASRIVAFCVPNVPLAFLLGLTLSYGTMLGGEGGGIPVWFIFAGLLVVSVPVSAVTVWIVREKS
jgi:hypothetical protein